MVDKNRRFVFLMENGDDETLYRYTVVASTFTQAWELLAPEYRRMTLYGMFSFKLEDKDGVA